MNEEFMCPLKILYYNTDNTDPETVVGIYQKLYDKFQGNVIALPMDFKLLCNASLEELEAIKNNINEAIKYKKEIEKRMKE